MKKYSIAMAFALLMGFSGSALAAVVTVTGVGQGFDPLVALDDARVDAQAKCTAQGGTPLQEVFNHITKADIYFASSVWQCDVP